MPLPGFLGKIFSGGGGELIDSIKGVVNEFHMSPEDKATAQAALINIANSHTEKMAGLVQAETDSYLKDGQDARNANTLIQESDKPSWLSKNVLYLLAIGITLGFFGLLTYMLKFDVPAANKDILNIMLGSLGTAWISIVGYFFGSSAGSKTAGDSIRKIAENSTNSNS